MKRFLLAGAAIAALLSPVLAADLPINTKAPVYAYPSTKCGIYYGVNTMGTTSAVENAAVGTQYVQGAAGLTLGYTCPVGGAGYWFVDGMFDFANLNGSANGLSLSGPAQFEQRFGFGAPINDIIAIIPGLASLQNALPSLPALPNASVVTGNPYLFVGLHEDDIGASFGLGANKEYLVSVGFGIGTKVRYSNGIVFDPFAEYIIPSSQNCIGAITGGCFHTGAGFRVGGALEF